MFFKVSVISEIFFKSKVLFKLSKSRQPVYKDRWARLLKQQSSITVYHLPPKEKKHPFSVSLFCLFRCRNIYIYLHKDMCIYVHICVYIYMYVYIYPYIYLCCCLKWKTEAQTIFLNPFNRSLLFVCLLMKKQGKLS